jgi:hypothetical protein
MNKFLTLTGAALLTLGMCLVDVAGAAAPPTILPGGCVKQPPSSRRDPKHFVIVADIKWAGNHYFHMPGGGIAGTCMLCPWEGCYIVVHGKTIRLADLPGDIVDQQSYRGRTLVLVGRLVREPGDRLVPPDVLIVEKFWSAS